MSASELKPNQNSLDTTRFVLLKKRGISQHARSSTHSTRVLLALRAIRHVIDKVSLHWSTEVVLFVCFLLCIDPQTKTHAQMENSRKKNRFAYCDKLGATLSHDPHLGYLADLIICSYRVHD